jgi:lipopolysaccharide/colanic/teichoic acid biosynthesis glycosyltransferase
MSTTLSPSAAAAAIDWDTTATLENGHAADAARYFRWCGILHRAAAAMLLVPAVPVILLLVLVVRLTSKGPGLFRQPRVGRHGKVFVLLKIRTMCDDAEAATGPVWTTSLADSRITRVGRVLRSLHLDEFPQLWNVLRGEMALVGPRPERPEFVDELARQLPGYTDRLLVLPGITGLAQINLPADSNLDSVRRKLVLDREYVRAGSLWLDVRILCCTALRLFGIATGRVKKLLRLDRDPVLEHRPLPQDFGHNAAAREHRRRLPRTVNGHVAEGGANGNGHAEHQDLLGLAESYCE